MAIQKIDKSEVQGASSGSRSIDSGAMGLVMDIVQSQQYSKPIQSTIRELCSNSIDSQSEKQRAIEILSGKVDPSEYFIERDGELYKDSNWDPTYYDVDKLNTTKNKVEIVYQEGETGIGRSDVLKITDYGVGLGGTRLSGVLAIG